MKMIFFISLAGSRYYKHEGFGFMAVSVNNTVFWDMMSCSLVEIYCKVDELNFIHLQGRSVIVCVFFFC